MRVSISGSVAQLLDSLEEVEILSHAKKNDIDFLHRFLDNNKFQSLLEVRFKYHAWLPPGVSEAVKSRTTSSRSFLGYGRNESCGISHAES